MLSKPTFRLQAAPPGAGLAALALALTAACGPAAAQSAVESGVVRSATTRATAGAKAPVPAARARSAAGRSLSRGSDAAAGHASEIKGPICIGGL
ncbi:MAG: hypothetical protein JSW68_07410, partial [Burkholderiales bacterium]